MADRNMLLSDFPVRQQELKILSGVAVCPDHNILNCNSGLSRGVFFFPLLGNYSCMVRSGFELPCPLNHINHIRLFSDLFLAPLAFFIQVFISQFLSDVG
jgi:hypothetical protein